MQSPTREDSPVEGDNVRKRSLDADPCDDEKESDNQSLGSPQNQMPRQDPRTSSTCLEIVPAMDPSSLEASPMRKFPPRRPPQSMQSIGAFAVQCSRCMQWRLIPKKEKYEEIRENILEEPFYCEAVQEWRPDVTCNDPPDISQDGSRVWAIDIPNISKPPTGWDRLLRIRCEGSTKFADVYYVAPSGKRLRSMVEVQKHLVDNPEYMNQGVSLSQFSFQTPKPLQENYLRKRPRLTLKPNDATNTRVAGSEVEEVKPLSWANPVPSTDLQLGMPGPSKQGDPSSFGSPIDQPLSKRRFSKQIYGNSDAA